MKQQGTVIAGPGAKKPFRDADRAAKTYGGEPSDWVKKSSTSHTAPDLTKFETHWIENIKTNQRFEFKTKMDGGE